VSTITRKPPTTPDGFRTDAEQAYHRHHPTAHHDGTRLVWLRPPEPVTFPDGGHGFIGTLRVLRPGETPATVRVVLWGVVLTFGCA